MPKFRPLHSRDASSARIEPTVTTTSPRVPTPEDKDQERPARLGPGPRAHIGWIVAGSFATGVLAALLFAAAPFIPAEESHITGAVLCGFALGWAMLAMLSTRFTDQPQQWAAAPAIFMGVSGVLLAALGSPVNEVLKWVWPPVLLALVIWMFVRARRQLRGRSRRWLVYPVLAVLALASLGGGYETVQEAADARAYPMPGRLIDVGGHSLHLNCTGSGSPTVVLEPGAGEMSAILGWVAPNVARETRVCVYDRAGRGWSESADPPQDGSRIAADLHRLLRRGHVQGPYVLVGHSFGGLYALNFASRYPHEVAAMVLVDSTAPASSEKPGASSPGDGGSYDIMGRTAALISTSARLGLARLYAQFDYGSLPPRSQGEARASGATATQFRSTIDEYIQGNASVQQAAALKDFTDKPLVVLTAGSGSAAGWLAPQISLAALSTNSAHHVIDGATHASLISDEDDAAATTQAIHDVVASVRSAGQLAK